MQRKGRPISSPKKGSALVSAAVSVFERAIIIKMRVLILLCLLNILIQVLAKSEDALLALDREIDGALVQSINVTVTYTLHNVGSRSASNILLKDLSFPSSRFTIYEGSPKHTWQSLPPGESYTSSMLVSPKRAGQLFVAPASVSYEADGQKRLTKLATDDSFSVEDLLSWRRRTDMHQQEWMLFTVAFLILVIFPALIGSMKEGAVPQPKKKV